MTRPTVRIGGALQGGGGSGGGYTPPSWPDIEADEEFRAALDTHTASAFLDVSGKGNHGTVNTPRPGPSGFIGKAAMASMADCRVTGIAALRRTSEWTVDMVIQKPGDASGTQSLIYLANTGLTSILGGLRSAANTWQIWTPTGWVGANVQLRFANDTQNVERIAITMQWGSDDKLRLWLNGWNAYTSASALTPPTAAGDEGIYIPFGPSIEFLRYRAAAPESPHSWHSAALYGASA